MEEWIRWEPIQNLAGKYYLDDLIHSADGLILKLSDDNQKIEIFFDGCVEAYRYTNESYYTAVFLKLSAEYGANFYAKWDFFKVIDSEYLAWVVDPSHTLSNQVSLTHFCIMGRDEVVDVIANHEPTVTTINSESAIKKTEHD